MHPIVLSHGIARFDVVLAAVGWNAYFKLIPEYLRARGFQVYETKVGFADSVEDRAIALKQEILEILKSSGADKVHIIGHSMGGLVARKSLTVDHLNSEISNLKVDLITLATPFGGMRSANMVRLMPISFFNRMFGLDESFKNLGSRSEFIRHPGQLSPNVRHFKIDTIEKGQSLEILKIRNQTQDDVNSQLEPGYPVQIATGHVDVLNHPEVQNLLSCQTTE